MQEEIKKLFLERAVNKGAALFSCFFGIKEYTGTVAYFRKEMLFFSFFAYDSEYT